MGRSSSLFSYNQYQCKQLQCITWKWFHLEMLRHVLNMMFTELTAFYVRCIPFNCLNKYVWFDRNKNHAHRNANEEMTNVYVFELTRIVEWKRFLGPNHKCLVFYFWHAPLSIDFLFWMFLFLAFKHEFTASAFQLV